MSEEVRMFLEILEALDGAPPITKYFLFCVLGKEITIPNDPHPEDPHWVYSLPLTVGIRDGDRRDAGLLVRFGYMLEIEAIVA